MSKKTASKEKLERELQKLRKDLKQEDRCPLCGGKEFKRELVADMPRKTCRRCGAYHINNYGWYTPKGKPLKGLPTF